MADNAPSTPAPAATSAAATPVAAPQPAPASAAVTAPKPTAAAEPAPAAAASSPAQPATAPAPAAVEGSLIGDGTTKAVEPVVDPNKPPAPATPAPEGAVVYDLKLPEGIEADAVQMDVAKGIFAEAKMPPELAQKLTTFHGEQLKALGYAMRDHYENTKNAETIAWQQAAIADPELGGAKWVTTKNAVEQGLRTLFGVEGTAANSPQRAAHQGFVKALFETRAGNRIEIIRGLHKMVATRSEGRPAPVGGPSAPKKSAADTMYGNKAAAE